MLVPLHKGRFLPSKGTRRGNNEGGGGGRGGGGGGRYCERINLSLTHTHTHTQRATLPGEHVQYNTTPTPTLSSHIIPHQASTLKATNQNRWASSHFSAEENRTEQLFFFPSS